MENDVKNDLNEVQKSFSEIVPGIITTYAGLFGGGASGEHAEFALSNGALVSVWKDGEADLVKIGREKDYVLFRVKKNTAFVEFRKRWQQEPTALIDFSVAICGFCGSVKTVGMLIDGVSLRFQPQDIISGPVRDLESSYTYFYFPGL